jgi:hypothetical protein
MSCRSPQAESEGAGDRRQGESYTLAYAVEQIGDVAADDPARQKPSQKVGLALLVRRIEPRGRRCPLREQLREEAELGQGRVRVLRKQALRLGPEHGQPLVVDREEGEVRYEGERWQGHGDGRVSVT